MSFLLRACRAFFRAPLHESTSEELLRNILTCKFLLLFYENKWKINEETNEIISGLSHVPSEHFLPQFSNKELFYYKNYGAASSWSSLV